jgi:ribosomal protein S18 acetylase RimI-like enzyme
MEIRKATPADDDILVRHYLAVWESYGTPPEHMLPDAPARVLQFIREGRTYRNSAAFLAIVDGEVAGSAVCQTHVSPFPEVILPLHRQFGYIWSVYVEPKCRRGGLARRLVERALDHLRSIGCTTAVLHSSAAGERLYEQLGFKLATEMRLPLRD